MSASGARALLADQLFASAEALNLKPSDLLPTPKSADTSAPPKLPLPKDLNATQKDQISRLLSGPLPTTPSKGTRT